PQYQFLPYIDKIASAKDFSKYNVLIALDAANKARLGRISPAMDVCPITINIDHHPDNSDFAKINWIDEKVTSTSEQIFNLWKLMDIPLTKEAAICIYVGMLTDTGRWQYSNTTGHSLKVAAELLDLGVEPTEIFEKVYENFSVEAFKLLTAGLSKAVFELGLGFVYTIITQEDLKTTGAKMTETETLVDMLRSVKDINVAMVLKETDKHETKASLRSHPPVNVGDLARAFDGGGHDNAAGFVTNEKSDVVVEKVKRWLTASFS
ncbi:hypothetical protein LCGC14_2191980, partial [marine sediment metagenome]